MQKSRNLYNCLLYIPYCAPNCNVALTRKIWILAPKTAESKYWNVITKNSWNHWMTKKFSNRILMAGFAINNFIWAISKEDFTKGKVSRFSHVYLASVCNSKIAPNSIKDVEDIERFLFRRHWPNLNYSLRFKTFSSNYSLRFSYVPFSCWLFLLATVRAQTLPIKCTMFAIRLWRLQISSLMQTFANLHLQ